MKFDSLDANQGMGRVLLVYLIFFLLSLILSGRSPNVTKILVTCTLSFNSINQLMEVFMQTDDQIYRCYLYIYSVCFAIAKTLKVCMVFIDNTFY